ncbi:gluconate 2-dehydrogenase subunit 3 family protein [Thalassotalea fonticola]|uniref:Gluconate 2-dehydrogenase subunit 3 family protein n=1 Tax=Thalassotalea fonticola TaxID=3065649 RepID=A0ABZ0GLL2_9GAMM|nr:gluconate 2-dehydrogenase subunit 3 family protein [Colwelliaceae bacterium S1-1]
MDRRAAIGFLLKSLGVTATIPTLVTTLSGCVESPVAANEKLTFLSSEQYSLVQGIVDIILPKTDIVGATELDIALFIDSMLTHTVDTELKSVFKQGAQQCSAELFRQTKRSPLQAEFVHYQQLIAEFFDIDDTLQQDIFIQQSKVVSELNDGQRQQYNLYKFLLTTRQLCLLGFYTSEYVGEHILSYAPIPGEYDACVDLDQIGNAWSA